jgi:cytochrome c553
MARGKNLAVDCADCHGDAGLGDDDIPAIAGLEESYIIEQLTAFKSGDRVDEDEMMIIYVEDLSDLDMADLAAYFSSLPAD